MIYRTSKREEFVKFCWDENKKIFFSPDMRHIPVWAFKGGEQPRSLQAIPSDTLEPGMIPGEWYFDPTEVNPMLALFVQLVKKKKKKFF